MPENNTEIQNETNDKNKAEVIDNTNEKKSSLKRIITEILIYVILLFICVFIIPKYVLQRTVVSGDSMLNTLHDNESLLVEKVSYKFSNPDRFDIVVFYPYGREDKENYYVKRIIGLPGETVQIKGEDIYINGQILEENYGKDPITDEGLAANLIELKEDEYFVLGDNREISEDSRVFGPVPKSNIEGHAFFRIYPFNKFGSLSGK